MAMIGQIFGQQGLVDPFRQQQANDDYQRAYYQQQMQQQMQAQPRSYAEAAQRLGGLGTGGISGNTLSNKAEKKKEAKVMNYVRDYFIKHRELLMGLTLVILLDHFIFGGAFREKTQKIVHALLDKTEKKLALEG